MFPKLWKITVNAFYTSVIIEKIISEPSLHLKLKRLYGKRITNNS